MGRLWIFYSDASHVRSWGTIAGHGTKVSVNTRDIICRQLGYDKSNHSDNDPTGQPALQNPDQAMIWLTNFSAACYHADPSEYTNLLQCNPVVCDGCKNHSDDLIISCGK